MPDFADLFTLPESAAPTPSGGATATAAPPPSRDALDFFNAPGAVPREQLSQYVDQFERQRRQQLQQRQEGEDWMAQQARAGRPYEAIADDLRQRAPGADPRALEHSYRSLHARVWADQNQDAIKESWVKLPGWSLGQNVGIGRNIANAQQRIRTGQATQDDYDWLAVAEQRQRQDERRSTGERVLREVAGIPALALETLAAGPVIRGATAFGTRAAVGLGASAEGLLARGAGYAAGALATPAAVPSMGFYQGAAQGDPLRSYAISAANAAVLNSVGRIVQARLPGGGVGMTLARTAAGAPVGMAEQQVADLMTGWLHDDNGYGLLGHAWRGDQGGLMQQAAVQAATFAAFSGQHEVMTRYREASQSLARQGLTSPAAGARLNNVFEQVQRNPDAVNDYSGRMRRLAEVIRDAGRSEIARGLREGFNQPPPDTRLQPEGPQPQGSQLLGMERPQQTIIHQPPAGPEPGVERGTPEQRRMSQEQAQRVFGDVLSPEGEQIPEQTPAAPPTRPEPPEGREGQRDWFGQRVSPESTPPTSQPEREVGSILDRMRQRQGMRAAPVVSERPLQQPEQLTEHEQRQNEQFQRTRYEDIPAPLRQQLEANAERMPLAERDKLQDAARGAYVYGGEEGFREWLSLQQERQSPPETNESRRLQRLQQNETELADAQTEFRRAVEEAYRVHQENPPTPEALHEQLRAESDPGKRAILRRALIEASHRRSIAASVHRADAATETAAPPAEAEARPAGEPAPAPAVRSEAAGNVVESRQLPEGFRPPEEVGRQLFTQAGHLHEAKPERVRGVDFHEGRINEHLAAVGQPDFSFGDLKDSVQAAGRELNAGQVSELLSRFKIKNRGTKEKNLDALELSVSRKQDTWQKNQFRQPAQPQAESMLQAAQRRGGISYDSVARMLGPEEAKKVAQQNPGIFKGGRRPVDALAEEMQRAGELRVPEHLNPADALLQNLLEKKPRGAQDFGTTLEASHQQYLQSQAAEAEQQARETPGEAHEGAATGPGPEMQLEPGVAFRNPPQPGDPMGRKFGAPVTPAEEQGAVLGGGQSTAEGRGRPLKQTALANAQVDQERQARGEQPLMQAARLANATVWDRAMERIDNDPGLPDRLINELHNKPRATTVEENAILLRQKIALSNEHNRSILEILRAAKPRSGVDGATMQALEAREVEIGGQINRLEQVLRSTGTEWGRAGQFRRQLAAEDYSLGGMLRRAEAAARRPLTDAERDAITKQHEEIAATQQRLTDAEDRTVPAAATGAKGDMADLRIQARKSRQAFDQQIRDFRRQAAPLPMRILTGVRESFDFVRSLITSADLSSVFRQGGFLSFAHPVQAAKAVPDMLRSFVSQRQFDRAQDALNQRPNAPLYRRAGLYLADAAGPPSAAEEAFAGRVSRLGGTLRTYLGINAAERAYTGFLNRVRADTFDAMAATLGRGGVVEQHEAQALANFINVATGRGQLGETGEKAAGMLAQVFFSPRYVASRFQLLAGQPLYGGSAATRKLVALEYARAAVGVGVFYGLAKLLFGDEAKLEGDPRSADFGKVRLGNTRIDPLTGLAQNTVFVSRLLSGQTRSSTTGRLSDLRGPNMRYGGQRIPDVLERFLRSKLAPLPGAAVNLLAGENVVGEQVTARSLATELTVPLALRDAYGALQDLGVSKGSAASILGILGMGVQTYDGQHPRR